MVDLIRDGVHVCRKSKTCDQCMRLINVGDRYRKQVYVDGELCTYRAHEDCDQAVMRYGEMAGLNYNYDEPINLRNDLCREDYEWLLNEFPGVADRFGIQGPVRPAA